MSKQLTKAKIMQCALELFVRKGVSETSVRDLAQAAGIAEGTLYRHYASKEDLVRDLFEKNYAVFAERIDRVQAGERGIRAKLSAVVKDTCSLYDENPTLYRFLLLAQHEALPRLPKGATSPLTSLRKMIEGGIERGEVKLASAHLGAALVLGLLVQPALSTTHGGLKGPLGRYAADIARAAERVLT